MAGENWVGSVVKEEFDDDEAVIAAEGLVERGVSPSSDGVGVGAVFESELDAVLVVPVGLAQEDGVEAVLIEPAAFEEELEDGVVVGFHNVVWGLFVVGIGAAIEEEFCEAGMAGDSGGSVDGAFESGAWSRVVDHFVPAGVGAGSGVEEKGCRVDEGFGTGFVEAEIAGKAEVREGVPLVRPAFGGGVLRMFGEKSFDCSVVCEDGCGVDVGGRDVRVAGEDEFGVFECAGAVPVVARDAGHLDKRSDGVLEFGYVADEGKGFDVSGEFGPALETVFAGKNELGVGECEGGGGDFRERKLVKGGVMLLDAFERRGFCGTMGCEEFFGLFAVLLEVGLGG